MGTVRTYPNRFTIVNMARNQNIACVLLVCIFNILTLQAKIFSKSLHDFRLFQEPDVNKKFDVVLNRFKRDNLNNTDFTTRSEAFSGYVHSSNLTISSTEFSLHGENDNEVFVHWTGPNNDVVFVLTRDHQFGEIKTSTLWRSTDYGETYSKADFPADFMVNHMFSSKANKSRTVLSDILRSQLFVTTDTGESWRVIKLNFQPHRMLLHPTIQGLALAYDLRNLRLYVSEDFCETWRLLKERVTERFFFGVEGVDNDTRTIHMELQDPRGPVTYFACTAPNCDTVPVDQSVGTIDFYSLVVEGDYIFAQKSTDDLTSLYVSYKRGPFKRAFFPTKMHPLDFNIVDTSDGQVFLVVDHEENVATLYVSDVTGQFYVTSMDNVVGLRYPGKFDVDIVKVGRLRGVYLCNKFETDRTEMGFMTQRTYVTYNKGGTWRLLDVPKSAQDQCENPQTCHLHLHISYTNTFLSIPLVVSVTEAPGLILAHGSVGTFLDPMKPAHVYISRDAGLTWTQAPFFGNHFLNILDQGSAISAIPTDGTPTNTIYYSSTEGKTWSQHNFTSAPMIVDGIVSEPGIKTLISSVFGHKNTSGAGWLMVKLDFSSVLSRQCGYADFEQWSPSAAVVENSVRCVMGETVTFERRKQTADCFVGDDYTRPKSVLSCTCTRDDFECDFGHELSSEGTSCVKSSWFNPDLLPAPVCIHGTYNKTQGYRRVASSNCEGGVISRYMPKEEPCPLLAPKGLAIVSSKTCVQRGANVSFTLVQESGSEEETNYTWSFGNASAPVTFKGLHNAVTITRSFHTIGHYNITVTAVNSKGKAQAVLPIHVEDGISSILVEIPWGARIGTPSYFNVTVLGSDNSSHLQHSLHFAWQFENKKTGSIRQLTWQNVIQQQFDQPGEYILTLNVFNSVSSVFHKQAIEVYEDVTTVRLHFSKEINNYNSQSLNIRQALAEILCHNIAQILMIRRSRIILSVPPMSPIVSDVTILPPNPDLQERDTNKVVQLLIDEAKQQLLSFPLFTRDDLVIITDAGILDISSGMEEPASVAMPTSGLVTVTVPIPVNVTMVQEKHSLLAVYVSVPVVIVVVLIAAALIVYYKKKLRSHKKYYPIVKHRSRIHHDSTCSCGEEDILGLEDPEDIIIPDNEYPDNEPTLMILNEPRSSRNQDNVLSNQGFDYPRC